MSFRARLTSTFIALAAVPVLLFGYGVQRAVRARLDADAAQREAAAREAVAWRLLQTLTPVATRLETLADELSTDNRFRLALADEASPARQWLLDWAGVAMRGSGLDVLQLHDAEGRIVSSGHFRNEFGRLAPAVPGLLSRPGAVAAVLDARTPSGTRRTIVRAHGFSARGERFTLVGGTRFDSATVARLSGDPSVAIVLTSGARDYSPGTTPLDSLPFVDDAGGTAGFATLATIRDPGPTLALQAGVRTWLLSALALTLLLAVATAALLARLVSAPVAALSARTATLDLDRLDQRFATGRDDEIGALERTLDALTARLRASVARLRDAERAAATGDLARQVNHDIKNGLAPIRNVLRHLSQVAEREPTALAPTFLERRGTLESSVEYLDALSRNYARLSPSLGRGPVDARAVIREVTAAIPSHASLALQLPDALPPVLVDAVVLKRILDNLLTNAIDALEGRPGSISVRAEELRTGPERRVRIAVTDTGRGMTRAELDRAFDDFHTTKPSGTGLGLSVVRRLVGDVGGAVRAETEPGAGSTFTIDLPAA